MDRICDRANIIKFLLYNFAQGSVVSDSLQPHRLQPFRLLCSWNFLGKNIGVGCQFLLQRISPMSPALEGKFFTTRAI